MKGGCAGQPGVTTARWTPLTRCWSAKSAIRRWGIYLFNSSVWASLWILASVCCLLSVLVGWWVGGLVNHLKTIESFTITSNTCRPNHKHTHARMLTHIYAQTQMAIFTENSLTRRNWKWQKGKRISRRRVKIFLFISVCVCICVCVCVCMCMCVCVCDPQYVKF